MCNFIKKETLAQVFSFEFCKISKNTFFTEHLRATTSEVYKNNYFENHLWTAASENQHLSDKFPEGS